MSELDRVSTALDYHEAVGPWRALYGLSATVLGVLVTVHAASAGAFLGAFDLNWFFGVALPVVSVLVCFWIGFVSSLLSAWGIAILRFRVETERIALRALQASSLRENGRRAGFQGLLLRWRRFFGS